MLRIVPRGVQRREIPESADRVFSRREYRKSGVYRYWYRIHGRCPRYKGPSPPFFPIACRTTKSHAGSVHPPAVPVLPARRLFVPVVIPEKGKSSRLTKKYIPARESSRDADIGRRCCAPPPFITESPQETAERSQGVKGKREKAGKRKLVVQRQETCRRGKRGRKKKRKPRVSPTKMGLRCLACGLGIIYPRF